MPHISVIVDDEPAIRRYIMSILDRENFQTVEAEDGTRGLQLVRELGETVELIVSDIQMPNGDGLTFARAVKQSFPAVPVILISGCAEPDGEFDGFIRKPFPPHALVQAVRNVRRHAPEPALAD